MSRIRAKVRITGRVQEVWFRQRTKENAQQQNVTGWCRNNQDGSVEAVFEGEESAVKTVVEWCRQGPESARVEHLDVVWETPTNEFRDFRIL